MKYLTGIILFLIFGLLLVACDPKEKEYPNTPEISFVSLSSNVINYTDSNAAIHIDIEFTDGDGDIARNQEGTDSTIFLIDSREGSLLPQIVFPMPYIPRENRQKNGGIKARTTISLQGYFFMPRLSDTLHATHDTLSYEIYFKDEARRESNKITVGPIYMEP